MPAPDRRLYDRRILRVTAALALSPSQLFEVKTTDICLAGVSIIAGSNLKAGTPVSIRIPLPLNSSAAVIEARAEVTHSILASGMQGFKVGLRFMNLDEAASSTLQRFMK